MTPDEWVRLCVALGFGGVIMEVIRSYLQRRKMGADYAEVISRSAVGLLAPLEERVHDLERQLSAALAEVASLRRQVAEARRNQR